MDSKMIFLWLVIILMISLSSCFNTCESDAFGNNMTLVLPINTTPAQDTFFLGDTLWVEANIDKYVAVEGETERIFLEGFSFFTKLIVSEISDTIENFVPNIEIIEVVGEVEFLSLPTLLVQPLFFEEEELSYQFKAGVILNEVGRFYINFDTSPDVLERYEHPAMYRCEDERRKTVNIKYSNLSTTEDAYENIFLKTNVDYLIRLIDYPRHAGLGAHTFIVRE